ncbi:hypothetical protein SCP_1900230 [Sparassis crispa]|uniref:Uncharacterized protein n=1 Tax=Sparassis crispa TaxID=139825 RepID=A0A401H6X6_9APHY|nr:hypothetical protein SCP_1900230 [Sparassis crispa]GBE90174.1 hypothetical protein SCP_1900230 [Sparassis crispa]
MTGYYWLDGQEHSLCPAHHTYLATPLRTSEVTVIISDIGCVANTLRGWVEVNNLTHWLTIADWLVERHLHLTTLHECYACEDGLTTIKHTHHCLDALAERWGADVAHAMFDMARTCHHVTRDHIKCDTSTPTMLGWGSNCAPSYTGAAASGVSWARCRGTASWSADAIEVGCSMAQESGGSPS